MAETTKKSASKTAVGKAPASGASSAKPVQAKDAPAKKASPKKVPSNKSAAAEKAVPAAKAVSSKKAAPRTDAGRTIAAKKTAAPRAGGTKAPVKKSPFGQRFLDSQRAVLLSERAKYLVSADTLRAEADALVESREPGDVQFDEESGEGDTLAVERERDLALSAHATAAVEQIDQALKRIEAGTYGICVLSGLAIPRERLEAIPWAAERVEYKAGGLGRR